MAVAAVAPQRTFVWKGQCTFLEEVLRLVQGVAPANFNPADPNAQAQMLALLHQLGVAPPAYAAASPPAPNTGLEQLLAHIARQPELSANLPGLLSQIAGMGSQQAQKLDTSAAQADAGPSTFSQQLYGTPTTG